MTVNCWQLNASGKSLRRKWVLAADGKSFHVNCIAHVGSIHGQRTRGLSVCLNVPQANTCEVRGDNDKEAREDTIMIMTRGYRGMEKANIRSDELAAET